jgi:hypothetical protein
VPPPPSRTIALCLFRPRTDLHEDWDDACGKDGDRAATLSVAVVHTFACSGMAGIRQNSATRAGTSRYARHASSVLWHDIGFFLPGRRVECQEIRRVPGTLAIRFRQIS